MENIISVIAGNTEIIIIVAAILFLAYLFISIIDDSSRRKRQAREKFLKLLKGNIEKGNVLDLKTLGHIKQAVERESFTEIVVSNMLQDVLLSINDPESSVKFKNPKELSDNICKLIEKENESAPFENLPEEERRLLRGLEDAIKHNDATAVKFHLGELNTVISVRNVEHARSLKMNRWSVPLAVVGLVFTIIFGITGMLGPSSDELERAIKKAVNSEFEMANKSMQPTAEASAD